MRIHTIEHVPFEGPAAIADYAEAHGYTLTRTRMHAGEPLPAPGTVDLLAVMGGPMSVHDEAIHPWLAAEKRYIAAAVDAGVRVLGVCLGAQLLSTVLGGQVTANPAREIGWHSVELTAPGEVSPAFAGFPKRFPAFHWHGETFSTPPGAIRTASSEACATQAFAVGSRLVGLQFHLETTPASMQALIENAEPIDLVPAPFVQTPEHMRETTAHFGVLEGLLQRLLGNMLKDG